jgi:hypothetical protein
LPRIHPALAARRKRNYNRVHAEDIRSSNCDSESGPKAKIDAKQNTTGPVGKTLFTLPFLSYGDVPFRLYLLREILDDRFV